MNPQEAEQSLRKLAKLAQQYALRDEVVIEFQRRLVSNILKVPETKNENGDDKVGTSNLGEAISDAVIKIQAAKNCIPKPRVNNIWFHHNDSDTVFVFIHGVQSDSRCWLHEERNRRTYWPALLKDDERFGNPSMFLGGYYTAVDAGPYEVRNCADELFGALNRYDSKQREPVMKKQNTVLVCHSMGGIVARYMLETKATEFADKKVGLVLIASPSYGSKEANRLDLLLRLFNHEAGKQLKWGNWSLQDLDDRFKDLIQNKRIPQLNGVELYENHFIVPRFLFLLRWKWIPFRMRRVVVTKESAGRYFGPPILMRNTDHFSIVKPHSTNHPTHESLLDFVTRYGFVGSKSANP